MAAAATSIAENGLQGETLASAIYIGWVPFCGLCAVLVGPNQNIWGFYISTVYCEPSGEHLVCSNQPIKPNQFIGYQASLR
jgi:hypothetical protein